MKKWLCLTVIALLLFSSCSAGGPYKRISLGAEMSGDKHDIMETTIVGKTKVENHSIESYSNMMPVYKITPRTITREEFQTMAVFLGIEGEILEYDNKMKLESNNNTLLLEDGNTLSFWGDNGIREAMTQTDAELETASKAIFDILPLIEGEYEYLV